ncbi:MAG: hypothetical protein MMC33_007841 [Icmadophila ericetorum]|nr:hypothetical protein [Icmadophila ericetorum]
MGRHKETKGHLTFSSPSKQLYDELQVVTHVESREYSSRMDALDRENQQKYMEKIDARQAEYAKTRKSVKETLAEWKNTVKRMMQKKVDDDRAEAQRRHEKKIRQEQEAVRAKLEKEKFERETKQAERRRQQALVEQREAAIRANQEEERRAAEAAAQAKKDEEERLAHAKLLEEQRRRQGAIEAANRPSAPPVAQPPQGANAQSQRGNSTMVDPSAGTDDSLQLDNPERKRIHPTVQAEHDRYLEIHQNLKHLRKHMQKHANAQGKEWKDKMNLMKRTLKKCVGQLTEDKVQNRRPRNEIIKVLTEATTVQNPFVDLNMFFCETDFKLPTPANGPALLVYLLNILSKAIIAQLAAEAGIKPQLADPIGAIASAVFANSKLLWNGRPLVDILIAKYHVSCPVLYGIYGDEKTDAGKKLVGWVRTLPDEPFVTEAEHTDRMVGLGAGFAALSLRNYKKSSMVNPYPQHNWWKSLALIINTEKKYVTATHLTVLGAMIDSYEPRVLEAWGNLGGLALRTAIVEFAGWEGFDQGGDPGRLRAARGVRVLRPKLAVDKLLYL